MNDVLLLYLTNFIVLIKQLFQVKTTSRYIAECSDGNRQLPENLPNKNIDLL